MDVVEFGIAGSLGKLHIDGKLPIQHDVFHMVQRADLPDALGAHGLPLISFDVGTGGGAVISDSEGGKVYHGIMPEAGNETAQKRTAQEHQTDQKAGAQLSGGIQADLSGCHEPGSGENSPGFDLLAPAEHPGIPDDTHWHQLRGPDQGQITGQQNGDNRKSNNGQNQPELQSKPDPMGHHKRQHPHGDASCNHCNRGDQECQDQILPAEHPSDLPPGCSQSPENADFLPALAQNTLHGTGDADAAAEDQRSGQCAGHHDHVHQLFIGP